MNVDPEWFSEEGEGIGEYITHTNQVEAKAFQALHPRLNNVLSWYVSLRTAVAVFKLGLRDKLSLEDPYTALIKLRKDIEFRFVEGLEELQEQKKVAMSGVSNATVVEYCKAWSECYRLLYNEFQGMIVVYRKFTPNALKDLWVDSKDAMTIRNKLERLKVGRCLKCNKSRRGY